MFNLIHGQAERAHLSDGSLTVTVKAAARGDRAAWDALVRRFTPLLRGVVRGYHLAPHDVDDVVQSCWLIALGSLADLRDPEALAGWLVTTARRQALRAHQRNVREILTDRPVPDRLVATDCVETDVINAERAEALRDAVRRLSGRQRLLLESLIADPDRSYLEVSERLGMPVGSIGPTRERGLGRLRKDGKLAGVIAHAADVSRRATRVPSLAEV
jgi:RNA polymerase sigma factor (sigma-70 family)